MKLKYWATDGNTWVRIASVPDGIRREVRTVSAWAVFFFCPFLIIIIIIIIILVEKPEGKRPLWRPRRRWLDNVGMGLQEVGCGYVDWIGMTQDRDRLRTLVSAVMNLRVP